MLLSLASPSRAPLHCSSLILPPPNPLSSPSDLHLVNATKWRTQRIGSRGHMKKVCRKGCRASLAQDAPLAAAIGVCILNSLVFPASGGPDGEEDGGGAMDSTDTRLAVMGVISFIPYFNWLSWIFAWLDSGNRRYLVYSIVYIAPYLRTNLSLSPEESWLPVASILLCIIHVQLETSIKNGDDFLNLFSKNSVKGSRSQDYKRMSKEGRRKDRTQLPSAHEESRNKLRDWESPEKPVDRHNESAEEERRKSD